ncbi:MAG: hypothetical protein A2Y12_13050 [Planctomycetes bacterium GWF2_42_9]|nr:MAG: hypothetical protein A2Y12_13050 [Planctomycetes bacterium GWF2_42_9]
MNKASLKLAFLFVISLSLVQLVSAGDWPVIFHVYRGSTPVIDGNVSPGEYDDASTINRYCQWMSQFSSVLDTNDLFIKVWAKHDGNNLFFAFKVNDDILYAIDTPRWLPDENPNAHDFTLNFWPWFGDGVELCINADNMWSTKDNTYNTGDGRSWQIVCNLTKSLIGGLGKGGLIQGEQRDNPVAWPNYEKWIRSGAMKAVAKPNPRRKGYIIEWMVKPNPCLEVSPRKFWNPSMGTVRMGLNIGVQDLDEKEKGKGNFGNFHHEQWWAGEKDKRTWPKQWGTMVVHPGYKSG